MTTKLTELTTNNVQLVSVSCSSQVEMILRLKRAGYFLGEPWLAYFYIGSLAPETLEMEQIGTAVSTGQMPFLSLNQQCQSK